MKKVFIIGRITANEPMRFIDNIKKGINMEAYLISQGFNVSHHFLDFNYLLSTEYPVDVNMLRQISLDDLRRSNVALCLFGWEGSPNCITERDLAIELNKRVYYDVQSLIHHEKDMPF
ncbi:MAG TPA: hypothetical protein PLE74_01080 [Candidatus Cloacimonadota bacterium]|nr:hypothetical protein [Candidatus Cloacimonadota bacterium]